MDEGQCVFLGMKNILLFFLLGFLWNRGVAQVFLKDIAFSNATIIDANHRALEHQTIVLRGKTIAAIFPDGLQSLPDSAVVFNLKGKYVIPGLIDTHVHMATDPSGTDNRAATLRVLENMLYTGITSVRDMAGDARTLASLSRDAQTGDVVSPDIYYSALMAGPSFFQDPRTIAAARGGVAGKMPYMKEVSDSTILVLAVAEAKGTGASGIKLYAQLPPKLVSAIVTEAQKQGLKVWGHAWLSPAKPSDLIKAGVSSISHAPLIIRETMDSIPVSWKNSVHPDQFWDQAVPSSSYTALFQLMREHHTIFDATMATYQKWGKEDPAFQYDYEIAKRITAQAYKAGVTICTGTDDDQESLVQHEMHLLVYDAGMSAIDALTAATLHGAEAIGIDGMTGTIDPGKAADLVVLDRNPLTAIDNVKSVFMVVKAGKIFKK